MLSRRARLTFTTLPIRRLYSSQHGFQPVPNITGPLNTLSVEEFRTRAFSPEIPLLITAGDGNGVKPSRCAIPAAEKWFTKIASASTSKEPGNSTQEDGIATLSQEYLRRYASTLLPYELITAPGTSPSFSTADDSELTTLLKHYTQYSSPTSTFHTFTAPLSLFLLACQSYSQFPFASSTPQLYIAQAQLTSLPSALASDLPTSSIVSQAGKGDIYDSNLWLGIPPTYTPLHKDPNPNLFIQLAGRKKVRMFEPRVGGAIFRDVQGRIARDTGGAGFVGGGQMRGSEMMEGPEREALWDAVWENGVDGDGDCSGNRGFETIVGPGDALFLPKGWWHSFRSVGEGVTGSVNWWFR